MMLILVHIKPVNKTKSKIIKINVNILVHIKSINKTKITVHCTLAEAVHTNRGESALCPYWQWRRLFLQSPMLLPISSAVPDFLSIKLTLYPRQSYDPNYMSALPKLFFCFEIPHT